MGERDEGVRTLDGSLFSTGAHALKEYDLLLAEHELIGEVSGWFYDDNEKDAQKSHALDYVFGVHDMTERLIRMAGWITTG